MRNNFADINVLLDKSGSMASLVDDTIGGFNLFTNEQKKQEGEAQLTLVQFDDSYDVSYRAVDIKTTPQLNKTTYIPYGNTRLHDSIARLIDETGERLAAMPEDQRPDKVIVVIVTDGQENASRIADGKTVLEKITHQREAYNWQFIFMGANQDAIATAASIGIAQGKSMTYASKEDGTSKAFVAASYMTSSTRCARSKMELDSLVIPDSYRAEQEDLLKKP